MIQNISAIVSTLAIVIACLKAAQWFGRTQAMGDALVRGQDRLTDAIDTLIGELSPSTPRLRGGRRSYDPPPQYPDMETDL